MAAAAALLRRKVCSRWRCLPLSRCSSGSSIAASSSFVGMVCKDSNFNLKAPRNATCYASPQVHAESPCITRHGMIVLRWSTMQSIACCHLLGGHTRGMCMRAQKNALKKKKKKTRRSIIKKLKQIRYIAKIKKHSMNREEKLLARIERAKKKKEVLESALKKYELPPSPPAKHDPESLTPEELHYLQRHFSKQDMSSLWSLS